jgi:hypothetical protein
MNEMTIEEVWEIKAELSQVTKNMTTEQLKEHYANVMREFYKIMGKSSDEAVILKPTTSGAAVE